MDYQILPDEVTCCHLDDGGAVVMAKYGYHRLFHRAFSDLEKARAEAAALLTRPFPKPKDEDLEPDF